jgi:hypothetical protein
LPVAATSKAFVRGVHDAAPMTDADSDSKRCVHNRRVPWSRRLARTLIATHDYTRMQHVDVWHRSRVSADAVRFRGNGREPHKPQSAGDTVEVRSTFALKLRTGASLATGAGSDSLCVPIVQLATGTVTRGHIDRRFQRRATPVSVLLVSFYSFADLSGRRFHSHVTVRGPGCCRCHQRGSRRCCGPSPHRAVASWSTAILCRR